MNKIRDIKRLLRNKVTSQKIKALVLSIILLFSDINISVFCDFFIPDNTFDDSEKKSSEETIKYHEQKYSKIKTFFMFFFSFFVIKGTVKEICKYFKPK